MVMLLGTVGGWLLYRYRYRASGLLETFVFLPMIVPEVILGVEQHDVPWVDQDRRPTLHGPAGRAASFLELDMETRLEVWSTVTERLVAQSPYAALLVSLHSTNIHTRYLPEAARPLQLLAKTRDDQDALLAVLPDATREQAERDADIVFALDALSLTLCPWN
jgi:ABC-type spermidine/putrescine transport system permease subunit II